MNTFSPFFPALIRLISALLRLISALMGPISALGNNTAFGACEHVIPVFPGAYKALKRAYNHHQPPALFWRLQAHSWANTAAVLAAGLGNKPFNR